VILLGDQRISLISFYQIAFMKKIPYFFLLLLFHLQLHATIKLPTILSDNMVLQQKSVIKLWGTSTTKKNITVRVSWTNTLFSCKAKQDGSWELSLFTPKGTFEKQSIIISDGNPLTLSNVLIGEVWLCAGQSNMAMTFSGYRNQPIENAKNEMESAKEESGIRMFNVDKTASYAPTISAKGNWLLSTPKNVSYFSVVGYTYAQQLQKTLNCPIGIINSSYGGSTIEGWLNQSAMEKYPDYPVNTNIPDSMSYLRPCVMFQGMIRPLRNYQIKGFVWYQGEGNVGRSATYAQKLQDLAYLWRFTFDNPELPFYVVEIAPYLYESICEPAKVREAQFIAAHTLANAGLVSTNDLVPEPESNNIHPSNKRPIGERLGNLSLLETYDYDTIQAQSPSFNHHEIHYDSVILYVDHTYQGLQHEGPIIGFELADAAHEFHPVYAKIGKDKNTIIIPLETGATFYALRYCFKNYLVGNVKNSSDLPLIPFRTDNWEE
jgi:sialate O-acetylesterase